MMFSKIHDMFTPAPQSDMCVQCREIAVTYPGYSSSRILCCHRYLLSGTWETGESQQRSHWILPVLGYQCPIWLSPFRLQKRKLVFTTVKDASEQQLPPTVRYLHQKCLIDSSVSKGVCASKSLGLLSKPQLRTIIRRCITTGLSFISFLELRICFCFEVGFFFMGVNIFQRRIFLFLPRDTAFRPQLRPGDNKQGLH